MFAGVQSDSVFANLAMLEDRQLSGYGLEIARELWVRFGLAGLGYGRAKGQESRI